MVYIKKLVMTGFKSFVNKTEIPFDNGINVIIGPNGSGKSNVSDALCFVLGRLGSKSLRASKSSNLIFQGTKEHKPGHEASVEIVFDNSDKSFAVDSREINIKRIVRRNGTSIYKITGETKTRQEVLELLSQSGIDPNGFNIVLQGEIARLIKMHPEERRQIIEEVSGIAVYEFRKQKSLAEIEKTEQKLKEVNAVLRERTAYLKNLEEERKQALKFKELEKTIRQCRATIFKRELDGKTKESNEIENNISKNKKYKEAVIKEIDEINKEITNIDSKINEINIHIQKATGFERDTLNEELADLNARIAANMARKENFERRLAENDIRKKEILSGMKETEKEIEEMRKKTPTISKRQEEIKRKKLEIEEIEEEKSKIYLADIDLNSVKDRIKDKEKLIHRIDSESKSLFNQINFLSRDISFNSTKECGEKIEEINSNIKKFESEINHIHEQKIRIERELFILESSLKKKDKLKNSMPKSGVCPLCQTKLTEQHICSVLGHTEEKIKRINEQVKKYTFRMEKLNTENGGLSENISAARKILSERQNDFVNLKSIEDKKAMMKGVIENKNEIEGEVKELKIKKENLEKKLQKREAIESRYNKLLFELQEISSRTDENLDTSILYKEKEIEDFKNVTKSIEKDKIEINNELSRISSELNEDKEIFSKKEKSLKLLNEKFKKLYDERTELQEKIKQKNILLVNKQNALNRLDEIINEFKVSKARVSASIESVEFELKEFIGIEFISGNVQFLREKLEKCEKAKSGIGSVNMRALEMYSSVKDEYEKIAEKVVQLEKERDDILKIIHEIDVKKKKTFMKTFSAINELFGRNFMQLSTKGRAFLEIENKENIFEGGITITIKIAKGKYFDVTSLSGGEQTLVALSLIFAIQEYKPYCFYIFDEIDAALDKRNSELLSSLLQKYMKTGQYIIISHNDSVILGANTIYGVSMNNGISKVISLKVEEE